MILFVTSNVELAFVIELQNITVILHAVKVLLAHTQIINLAQM